jgi:hypothetical protein
MINKYSITHVNILSSLISQLNNIKSLIKTLKIAILLKSKNSIPQKMIKNSSYVSINPKIHAKTLS